MSHTIKPPSLKMIADRLGVSTSLVSKVLNNRMGGSGATPQTVAAIHAVAREVGYRKNHAAAALVTGRQNLIGGFIHSIGVEGSGILEQVVRGLVDGAAQTGQRLMLRFFHNHDEFLSYMPEISPTLLDGMILAGMWHPELVDQFHAIEAAGVPIVSIHEESHGLSFPNIGIDQTDVMALATEHLIVRGCRRIAHVSMTAQREAGYARALAKHRIPYDPALVYKAGGFTMTHGEEAVAYLEAQQLQYDAIAAQSDHQAIGAMHALLRRGKRVPTDVKLIGVDDSPLCTTAVVPLSSVNTQFHALGMAAVGMLNRRIQGETVESQMVDPVLKPRASTLATELSLLAADRKTLVDGHADAVSLIAVPAS